VFKPIAKEIREEILHKIKIKGLAVSSAAEEYGISSKTIYTWLSQQNEKAPSALELSRLKRENQQLKEIIGMLTIEMERLKRGRR
jgi:transposase